MKYEKLIQHIEDIENDDENIDMLQKASEYYCGNYDLCEGYKHALYMTLRDQYENHAGEQADDDLDELIKILGLKTQDPDADDLREQEKDYQDELREASQLPAEGPQ